MRAAIPLLSLVMVTGCPENQRNSEPRRAGSSAIQPLVVALEQLTTDQRSVEAKEGIDRLRDGARNYYLGKHRFPASTNWTPATPCCQQPGKPRCVTPASVWDRPTWRDLGFRLDSRHYYQFRFTGTGAGADATYIIEARGDLDCDGVYSSFKFKGHVDHEYGPQGFGPFIENELE